MKKLFTKSLIAVGVAGLMGLTSVAMAAEFDWYGSIRAGVSSGDDGQLDIGATGSDGEFNGQGVYSRIGVRSSADLGNGQTAGATVELGVTGSGGLSTRHHNVWIGGGWGKLTFGQQGNPYHTAANWDQAWTLGGQVRHNDGSSRLEGITYSSNLAGPFSFDITVTGNETKGKKGIDRLISTAHYDFGVATVNLGYNKNYATSVSKVDEVKKTYTVTTNVSPTTTVTPTYVLTEAVKAAPSYDNAVISVNGSSAGFDWYLAYEKGKGNANAAGVDVADTSVTGLYLGYGITENDKIYLEYEKANTKGVNDNKKATLLGYSHSLGDGVTFIAEHSTVDPEASSVTAKVLNLILKVDF